MVTYFVRRWKLWTGRRWSLARRRSALAAPCVATSSSSTSPQVRAPLHFFRHAWRLLTLLLRRLPCAAADHHREVLPPHLSVATGGTGEARNEARARPVNPQGLCLFSWFDSACVMACGGGLGVCSGAEAGPRVLITGNIHGDEVTGTIVIHRFIERCATSRVALPTPPDHLPSLHLSLEGKLDRLKGTIVAIPSLNPTGHLQGSFALYQSHVSASLDAGD